MSMLLFGKPTSAMSETRARAVRPAQRRHGQRVGPGRRSTGAAFLQNVGGSGLRFVKVGFPVSVKIYLSIERMRSETDTDNMTQAAVEWLLSARTALVTGDKGKSSEMSSFGASGISATAGRGLSHRHRCGLQVNWSDHGGRDGHISSSGGCRTTGPEYHFGYPDFLDQSTG